MIGIDGKDLTEQLISARWQKGKGLILEFNQDAYPYVRTNEPVTISGKSYRVISCTTLGSGNIQVWVRGLKFELIHFRRLNKCLD